MRSDLLIGVDGGGTRTTAVAVRPDGRILARAAGGGLNFNNIGMEKAHENFRQVITRLTALCGADDCGQIVVGLSALDETAGTEIKRQFLNGCFEEGCVDLESDAYIALMGTTLGQPGAIAICGTGSMLLMLDENNCQRVSGGWGHLLNDAGSSYTIAMEALRACVDCWDGVGEKTALCDIVSDYFRLKKPRDLIARVYAPEAGTGNVAALAQYVLEVARRDDTAMRIVRGNMARLARQASVLIGPHRDIRALGVYGGVFQHNPWVTDIFRAEVEKEMPDARIVSPQYPPEIGAVIHALKKRGKLSPAVLDRLSQEETGCRQLAGQPERILSQ